MEATKVKLCDRGILPATFFDECNYVSTAVFSGYKVVSVVTRKFSKKGGWKLAQQYPFTIKIIMTGKDFISKQYILIINTRNIKVATSYTAWRSKTLPCLSDTMNSSYIPSSSE